MNFIHQVVPRIFSNRFKGGWNFWLVVGINEVALPPLSTAIFVIKVLSARVGAHPRPPARMVRIVQLDQNFLLMRPLSPSISASFVANGHHLMITVAACALESERHGPTRVEITLEFIEPLRNTPAVEIRVARPQDVEHQLRPAA